MAARAAAELRDTGYRMEADYAERSERSCTRACVAECLKPGRTFDFSLPFRP